LILAVPAPRRSTERAFERAPRLQSLDVLRGLDVLLMLFVNEMAGVRQTPAWLRHVPAGVDGMTITDVVFPAFLFISGMALPLALGSRLARGESKLAAWRHVALRTVALLVMGVFMVNAEAGSAPGFPVHAWNLLVTCGLLMAWHAPAHTPRTGCDRVVVIAGVVLLAIAAVAYRSADASGVIQLRPQWWGILGLIGWAYLVGASLYLLLGDSVVRLVTASAALYALFFLDRLGIAPWLGAFGGIVDIGSVIGSLGALLTSGAALTVLVRARRSTDTAGQVRTAAIFSAGLLAAGLGVHAFRDHGSAFFFNKPMATPAWCLVSAGLTSGAWAVAYWLVDVRRWTRWPRVVGIAGENPLLVYLIAPFVASLMVVALPFVNEGYARLGEHLGAGTIRSAGMAWLVVRISGWLRDRGVRLRI
jgi:heparan-alpha-glucosaminide N-acetyltransferase